MHNKVAPKKALFTAQANAWCDGVAMEAWVTKGSILLDQQEFKLKDKNEKMDQEERSKVECPNPECKDIAPFNNKFALGKHYRLVHQKVVSVRYWINDYTKEDELTFIPRDSEDNLFHCNKRNLTVGTPGHCPPAQDTRTLSSCTGHQDTVLLHRTPGHCPQVAQGLNLYPKGEMLDPYQLS
ncbi:hypothetical protein BCR33DRAFT_734236 [Rhizoclosmatium globosum]|uniref:Uncharacterized protein n=1 Tax=Rhizoclosmatium globosum TaxID=329046 RepID=A0A1Y2CVT3_9FUNG|nr:hypothetical protein BCR33DRAFT_734236 [Rhizoclosmatium globosum]|eukprot:ORY51133.1 hypothetical protein BCR33DRAFT_734236 [Rhizoclosmatium globosum]